MELEEWLGENRWRIGGELLLDLKVAKTSSLRRTFLMSWTSECLRRKSLWASARCSCWVPSSLSMAAVDSVDRERGESREQGGWGWRVEDWKDLPVPFFFSQAFFFNFLLITKIIFKKKKKAKFNGSSNWDLTKYYIDKNWNLEEWNDKTQS